MGGQRCRAGEDIDASLSEGVANLMNPSKRNLSGLFGKDTVGYLGYEYLLRKLHTPNIA